MSGSTSTMQATDELVEDIAQRKAKYEKLYREKEALMRAIPEQAQQFSGRFFMLECLGQTSIDDPRCRPSVLGRLEGDAATAPNSFEDQFKIHEAAHAILNYIVGPQIAEQPADVQRRIKARALELNPNPVDAAAVRPARYITKQEAIDALLSSRVPPLGSRKIDDDELEAFSKDTSLLAGKRFVLKGIDGQLTDFVVQRVGEDASGLWVEVQHEDCMPVRFKKAQMEQVLEDSFLID